MIRTIIICPNGALATELNKTVDAIGAIRVERRVDSYPTESALVRMLRSHAPHVVLLSFESEGAAVEVAGQIELHVPGTQVVAIHSRRQESALMAAIRSGVREFLVAPFAEAEFVEAMRRVVAHLERVAPAFHRSEGIFAFLPAKPGVGASTVAVNTSMAIASQGAAGTLLADLDVYSGMINFMLHLRHDVPTILDAAELSSQLDETLWAQLICRVKDLDVLATARLKTGLRLDTLAVRQILDYARRTYSAICVDLAGGFEDYNLEVLQEAKRILLICTPETCSLRQAREKVQFLRELELHEKVALVLNRTSRSMELPLQEIERLVGQPVMMSLPNDYGAVRNSLNEGQPVKAGCELAARYAELARVLLEKERPAAPAKRRFLEQVTLSPYQLLFGSRRR